MDEISIDNVVASLLYFLPCQFATRSDLIGETFYKFQQNEEYKDLLKDLWFIDEREGHYSPLLERAFARLQESRLLMTLSPDYRFYVSTEETRQSIRKYYLDEGKILYDYCDVLKTMAKELNEVLEKTDERNQ